MSFAIDPSRRPPQPACLALLLVLPGCLTTTMWAADDDGSVGEPRVHTEVVFEAVEASPGSLLVAGPAFANGIWWRERGERPIWRLLPDEGADVAARLLDGVDWCDVQQARIEAVRGLVGEEVVADEATLQLEAWFRPAALGQVVGREEISTAALDVLATPRKNAFVFAAEPFLFLPVVYRRCVQRLPAVDLVWLLDVAGAPTVESFVFVGEDGQPRFEPDAPGGDIPVGADDEQLSLSERLALLSEVSLLVRVQCGRESLVVRLRPDLLWLWAGTEIVDGRVVHRSSWHLEPAPPIAMPGAGVLAVPGDLTLRRQTLRRVTVEPAGDQGFLGRLAMTPLTLAIDLTVGLPFNILWAWLEEKGDDRRPGDVERAR